CSNAGGGPLKVTLLKLELLVIVWGMGENGTNMAVSRLTMLLVSIQLPPITSDAPWASTVPFEFVKLPAMAKKGCGPGVRFSVPLPECVRLKNCVLLSRIVCRPAELKSTVAPGPAKNPPIGSGTISDQLPASVIVVLP